MQFRHVVFPKEARRNTVIQFSALDPASATRGLEAPWTGEAASFVHDLFARSGLDARQYRAEVLNRRIPASLRALRVRSVAEARQRLDAAPELLPAALSAMLIGVSSFFRDPAVFALLGQSVLPDLARARRGLFVWSVGCSEGAETYSVAMLLAELGILETSYLVGSDCRADAIERARAGCFDEWAVRDVSPERRARFFKHGTKIWRVREPLRHAVRWNQSSILHTHEAGVWDLILFRNTAIYLQPERIGFLWDRLTQWLRPGGVLVLGKAERPPCSKQYSPVGPCVFRRTRG